MTQIVPARPEGRYGRPSPAEPRYSAEFLLLLQMAERLQARSLPFGVAAVFSRAGGIASCADLRDIIRRTTEFVAWGRCGPLCCVLFRQNLLREAMPLCRRLMERHDGLFAGVAFSGALEEATGLWLAARLALRQAMAGCDRLVVLDADAAAERIAGCELPAEHGAMPCPPLAFAEAARLDAIEILAGPLPDAAPAIGLH